MGLKQELIKLRWKVRLGTYDRHVGICKSVGPFLTRREQSELIELLRRWSEGTGFGVFPVPAHEYKNCTTAGRAYSEASWDGNMWNPFYKYGRARRRLLTWLINQL
jgi:hypothetical protein